ncbi:thioesterase family protein [Ruegeria sp. WL0004]|uniref:Thioesterase family protein n=1 Tax=Ruegeria marisflavi TaxID=2984152 RepID=A0ABT2WQW9_9RHOB|nr:thioesterase family protein [Ruegeria sp. WL0004]MCU9837642.1 thioesterase family protein [Ruegeria sp. WL0004]
MTAPVYFTQTEPGLFVGKDPARGPWSPDHCHAGPVTGLVVRAAEGAAGPGKMLTRLTLDVLRPLPLSGLRVSVEVQRDSRTLTTTRVAVHDTHGTLCLSGTSMHLVRKDLGDVPTADVAGPDFGEAERGEPLLVGKLHDRPAFGQFIEMAYPRGEDLGPGPKTVWMKAPHLLADEAPSPIQAICPLADCGNGISWNEPPVRFGFMNTDLTLQIHREPQGDWFAAQAVSHWQPNGVGMSQAVLYDVVGPVGMALQTIVLHPMAK